MKNIMLLLIIVSGFATAQIPAYYSNIDFEASPGDLEADLAELITSTHTYMNTYNQAWDYLKMTDLDPNDSSENNVLLLYGFNDNDGIVDTDRTRYKHNNGGAVGEWNREHVYPRSLGNPNLGTEGPGADPHMLRATDVSRNSARSNYPFTYGSGNSGNINGVGWYPGDEWKGDVARIIMYMYLRYGPQCEPNIVAVNSSNSFSQHMPDIFLTWNAEDPVSEVETQRNDYLQTQIGNRNPFIDNPYLATLIWGGPAAENTWNLSVEDLDNEESKILIYPNPTHDFLQISKAIKSYQVFSMDGRVLRSGDEDKIDIQSLVPDAYILKIVTLEGKEIPFNFIKN